MTSPAPWTRLPMRWRTLWILLAGVLLMHWGLLSGQANHWSFNKPAQSSLSTRTIAPEPTPEPIPEPAPKPAAVATPAPQKVAAPIPQKTPPEAKESKPISAATQEKPAQAATEFVAIKPLGIPAADYAMPPDDRISSVPTASTPTLEKSLDQQMTEGRKPGDSATVANPVELTFPASGSFAYNVLITGTETQTGSGTLEWSSDGRTYQLVLEAKKFGFSFLRQISAGNVSEAGLKPERYTDKRGLRSEQATHFQPDKGIISFANNKPNAPWISGAQDRLSVMMQLAGMVSGDPEKMLAQRTISMPVAGIDDAENWTFALEGKEKLELPAGTTTAVHLVRYPRKEFDRKVELWLSPQLDYMPVRIKLVDTNGNTVELSLRSTALKPELPKNTDPTLR